MKRIEVLVKDQYGKRVFYPKCKDALCFASISGTRTLSERVLRNIMELGYEIEFVQEIVTLGKADINVKEFRL
jgi:hypothetical protein